MPAPGKRQKQNRSRQPVSEHTVMITALGGQGDGLSAGEPRYFVPFTLPGERVKVRTQGKHSRATEILEPSPARIQHICDYFTRCGGCAVQHLDPLSCQKWKTDIIKTALQRQGVQHPDASFIDAHGNGRRRLTLHILFGKNRIRIGFMQVRSRELIEIDHCPITEPGLHGAVQIARDLAGPFQSIGKPLDMAFTVTESGLDCDIRGANTIPAEAHLIFAECTEKYQLARISVNGEIYLERQKPIIRMGGVFVPLPPASFLQATKLGEETLAQLVLKATGKAKNIADLFCGIGPFAIRLAHHARVFAADSNPDMIGALNKAVRTSQGLKPVTAEVRDLFRNPLYRDDLNGFDAVVINPARAGAHAQITEIAASNAGLLIYVSCAPKTLARDAAILTEAGFHIEQVTAVDQFRYSPHIETVAVFRR